jgi:hypothetical protein
MVETKICQAFIDKGEQPVHAYDIPEHATCLSIDGQSNIRNASYFVDPFPFRETLLLQG